MATLNVGTYGCTKAGKTRFLYQMLRSWRTDRRMVDLSENAKRFLTTLDAEMERHAESMPTVATLPEIRVTLQNESQDRLQLTFRDLRGEILSEQLDHLDDLSEEQEIPDQVDECDGFLFFFDPGASENPSRIEEHHEREKERAFAFIDYVLQHRQNRYLPIVFVLTHLDCWQADPKVRVKAQAWSEAIHQRVLIRFREALNNHFPPDLVDRNKIIHAVSSVEGNPGELVIDHLDDLVQAGQGFLRTDRRKSILPLVAGAVFTLVLLGGFAWMMFLGDSQPKTPETRPDRSTVSEWSESTVLQELAELEDDLRAQPAGDRLPTDKEAREINSHLQWMAVRIELGDRAKNPLSESTQKKLQSLFQQTAVLIRSKVDSARQEQLAEQIPILESYLADLPEGGSFSKDLSESQNRFWKRYKERVTEELRAVIRRRNESGSTPVDLLTDLLSELRKWEQNIRLVKVVGTVARQELLEEIKSTVTFCDDRKNTRKYPVTFRVVSARYTAKAKLELYFHSLQLDSAGVDPFTISLKPNQVDRNEPNVCTFTTNRANYGLQIGLGKMVGMSLHQAIGEQWNKRMEWDLAAERFEDSLVNLGMPLVRRNQTEIVKSIDWEGYEIKVEFSAFPKVPALLWDAAQMGPRKEALPKEASPKDVKDPPLKEPLRKEIR